MFVCFLQFSSIQLLGRVRLFGTPWTAACQVSNSRSLLKLKSIESVTPSNHLILHRPLLLPSCFLILELYSISPMFAQGIIFLLGG